MGLFWVVAGVLVRFVWFFRYYGVFGLLVGLDWLFVVLVFRLCLYGSGLMF